MQAGLGRGEGVLVIAARFENPSPPAADPHGDLVLVRRILQVGSGRDDAAALDFGEPEWEGRALTVDVRLSGLTARAVGTTIVATSAALDSARRVLRRVSMRSMDPATTPEDEVRTMVESLSAAESRASGARRLLAEHLHRLASNSALVDAAHRGLSLRASGWRRLSRA